MPKWLDDAVFYEIYPQSFYDTNGDGIGDIDGITEKLDYVKSLGCNAVWLNPCFDSPFMDAGYDVRDYKKVAPRYGTNEDLKRCFSEAHKRGMHLLLDLVPGHTSDRHSWFRESQKAQQNPYSGRYIWTDSVWNRPADFGCMCGVTERDGCYLLNFFSSQPALNYGFNKITAPWQQHYTHPDCVATREAMKDVMRFWLDAGCDGFRVDMADSLVKNDGDRTATAEIWRGVREMLDREYPEAAMVSEWSDPKQAIVQAGFHMDFLLDHPGKGYHSLFRETGPDGSQHSFFSKQGKGNIMKFLNDYLPQYDASKNCGYISLITCNHDTPRMTLGFDELECKIAYSFLLTMPGVPFLYYGDEIGMQYFKLPSVEGGYQRTGSRTPMQWNRGKNRGFSAADPEKLYLPVDERDCAPTVEEQEKDGDSLLHTVRRVLALRHDNPDLQAAPNFEVVYAKENEYPFVFRRGKFVIAVNPSCRETETPVAAEGKPRFLIGSSSLKSSRLAMGKQSFAVFECAGL
ncbi:glycosylase [Clostridium sp. W14A]|uniref:Glycosylase n=1 Tax=Caproicibacter fermentans TaxID=2576756 RepID=A0A7G8TAN8_9FIRM|nr:alpha-amylase family glycosyl hydrolase [Caproicibacter fermentans]OCN02901.1 glycosylase [Clostridium sp. W14A]QNK40679.1 glycosylase [Caproicibacter fermentans]